MPQGLLPSPAVAPKDRRRPRPEVMDDPALPADQHAEALCGLARINAWSRVDAALWPALSAMAKRHGSAKAPLRVLDVACGGGDVAQRLNRRAGRAQVPMIVDGCDLSARAVAWAGEADAHQRASGQAGRFFVHDALNEALPTTPNGQRYDAAICTLFLHHLTTAQAEHVLGEMGRGVTRGGVVLDLRRGVGPWVTTWLGVRLISRCAVVHTDGPRSVRAGWTAAELRSAAQVAGLRGVLVRRVFPMRLGLWWSAVAS